MIRTLGLLAIVVLAPVAAVATLAADEPARAQASRELTFERGVRPILKANCFQCHGDEEPFKAALDLRFARTMLKGGKAGAAAVAGQSAESLIHQRIAAGEMPPGEKKLTAKEIAVIAAWIDQGAKTARPEPEQPADSHGFSDDERSFWSFQPIRRPPVPELKNGQAARTIIDSFLAAELEKRGLGFSLEADKRTLIRRLYFDLVGLPPQPEAVERFIADESPDAYERLVDELLASPRYGERWGRHWLDVAGYADSDGYSEKDLERKYAYKYRDYVIRAFNDDKPWTDFIIEQLAGDELLTPPYTNLIPEQAEKLIATGFLRMAPDGTGDGAVEQDLARNEVVAETIKIVSTSLLGLTVGCAQCHNHRYDPITQLDYYRLRAIFEPAHDPKNWRSPQARLVSLWTDAEKQQVAAVDAELAKNAEERKAALEQLVQETFESEVAKLAEDQRDAARAARATSEKERTPEQKQLLKDHPSLNVNGGSVYLYDRKRHDEHVKKFDALKAEIQAKRPADDFAHCLTEVAGSVPATKLFFRGDFNQPRQDVPPGELTVLCSTAADTIPLDDPQLPTTGRRLAYARQLTSGTHPLVARVIVNRVWLNHFGRGIVATPGDFGALGGRPSHAELLDWLASEFMAGGWRLKPLHRLIVLSAAYRQSSRRTDSLDAADADNQLLGRMTVRRLEAESLRDSVLAVAGKLSPKSFGPPVPVTPDEVGQIIVGVDTRDSAGRPAGKVVQLGEGEFRRSVYVQARRSTPLSMLDAFDAPDMRPNCSLRNSSTVAPQSLLLMNNEFILTQAREFANRVHSAAGDDSAAQVRLAWQLAFAESPADAQVQSGVAFLTAQTAEFDSAAPPADAVKEPPTPPGLRALATYCQALLSSNRFLYVD